MDRLKNADDYQTGQKKAGFQRIPKEFFTVLPRHRRC
jgi:hypothetical protein